MRKGIIVVCLSVIFVIVGITSAFAQSDADKIGGDNEMCWAAAASNIFADNGWYKGKGGAQILYENFVNSCENGAGWLKDAWRLWIDGIANTASCNGQAECSGAGGYDYWQGKGKNFFDHYRYYLRDPSNPQEIMNTIECLLSDGFGVGIRISKMFEPDKKFDERYVVGHALTVHEDIPDPGDPSRRVLQVTDSDDEKSGSYALFVDSSGTIKDCDGCEEGVYNYREWQIEIVEALSHPDSKAQGCGHSLNQDVKFVFIKKICEEDSRGLCREGKNGKITITVTSNGSTHDWTCDSRCPGIIIPISVGANLHFKMEPDSEKYDFSGWEIWMGEKEPVRIEKKLDFPLPNMTEGFCLLVRGDCGQC